MMANRLVLEGLDDKHFIWNLLFNHELNGKSLCEYFGEKNLKVKEGIDNLIGTLKEELQATDLCRLGVILDADADLAGQWARVTRVLDDCGCHSVPAVPSIDGTIVETNDAKKIGIWLMPDNQRVGALEDFVGRLIAADDDLWPKAQANVDDIPKADRRFKSTYLSKAYVHTWLAWQEQPGTRMGQTFKKNYLDAHHPQALVFIDWIKRLLA